MSQGYNTRPSELLFIKDNVTSFLFDRAIFLFGTAVEEDIEQSTKKIKNQKSLEIRRRMVLQKWIPVSDPKVKGRFKDPALKF